MLVKTKGYMTRGDLDFGCKTNGYFDTCNATLTLEVDVNAKEVYDAVVANGLSRPFDIYIDVPDALNLSRLEAMAKRAVTAEQELAKLKASIQALAK